MEIPVRGEIHDGGQHEFGAAAPSNDKCTTVLSSFRVRLPASSPANLSDLLQLELYIFHTHPNVRTRLQAKRKHNHSTQVVSFLHRGSSFKSSLEELRILSVPGPGIACPCNRFPATVQYARRSPMGVQRNRTAGSAEQISFVKLTRLWFWSLLTNSRPDTV